MAACQEHTLLHFVHGLILVFSLVTCIITALNFGLEYPVINLIPLNRSAVIPYRIWENVVVVNYTKVLDIQADYASDPRSWGLVPFLSTMFGILFVAGAAVIKPDIYRTTTVLNLDFVLALLNLAYLLSYQLTNVYTVYAQMRSNWRASAVPLAALQGGMLGLLLLAVVICGRYLCQLRVAWPRCNFLRIFTISTLLCIARLIMGSSTLAFVTMHLRHGVYAVPSNTSAACITCDMCGLMRVGAGLYYTSLTVLALATVLAGEALLTRIWGVQDRQISIIFAAASGVCVLILSVFLSNTGLSSYGSNDSTISLMMAAGVTSLFHAWTLHSCNSFITSPPSILRLLCGVSKWTETEAGGTQQGEGYSSGADDVPKEVEPPGGPATTADEQLTIGTEALEDSNRRALRTKAIALIANLLTVVFFSSGGVWSIVLRLWVRCNPWVPSRFAMVLGLVSLSLLGASVNMRISAQFVDFFLITVVTAAVARAAVALLTVIGTDSPPTASTPQALISCSLECVAILVAAVVVLSDSTDVSSTVAGILALLIVLLQVLNLTPASPVRLLLHQLTKAVQPNDLHLSAAAATTLDTVGSSSTSDTASA